MLIDWFTVGAQMLNFLVLVWLLKRFLYKPILNAIDARETRIAAELADSAAARISAETERKEFQRKSALVDDERGAILGRAKEEAKAVRESLLIQAHQSADAVRVNYENAMRNDQLNLRREIIRMAQEVVFAIARKTLADLATVNLEESMSAEFMRRLRGLDAQSKKSLIMALDRSTDSVVRSAFDIPATQRAMIQDALGEVSGTQLRLRFETSPATVCGIELTAGDQKLAWSIADYLAELEKRTGSLVNAQRAPSMSREPQANVPATAPP